MKVGDLIARSLCKNASTRPDAFYCTQQQQQPGAEMHQPPAADDAFLPADKAKIG